MTEIEKTYLEKVRERAQKKEDEKDLETFRQMRHIHNRILPMDCSWSI